MFVFEGTAQIKALNQLPDTTFICSGDSFLLKFSENKIPISATYSWLTPKAIVVHAKQIYIKHDGLHIVTISDGKDKLVDSTYLVINDKPKISVRDTFICKGSVAIKMKYSNYQYLWMTGETLNQCKFDKPGLYWVKASNKGCYFIDTFRIKQANHALPNFGSELHFCENETNKIISMKIVPDNVKLYWNTGGFSSSIHISKEGLYWVKSISPECGANTDSVWVKFKNCECDLYIPNSFSPNDDEKNDLFCPLFQCEYSYFSLTVFDRWGNIVYVSNTVGGKWDGKYKGNPCPDDVYVYRLDAIQKNTEKKITRQGHISLFR
jgi:gliding motility-associated-like protein